MSTDGWIRRVGMVKDLSKTRLREGDNLLTAMIASTIDTVVFFSNFGSAYTIRMGDIPAARSGYGDPAQKLFKFKDGERIIAGLSLDPRFYAVPPEPKKKLAHVLPLFDGLTAGEHEPVSLGQVMAVSSAGMGVRFDLVSFKEPSSRLGRKFMKVREGEEVVTMEALSFSSKTPILAVATQRGRVLLCKAEEVGVLSGPGRGVTVIKLDSADRLLAARLLYQKDDQLVAFKQEGSKLPITIRRYQTVGRGGKGHAMFKRGSLKGVLTPPVELPVLDSENSKNGN